MYFQNLEENFIYIVIKLCYSTHINVDLFLPSLESKCMKHSLFLYGYQIRDMKICSCQAYPEMLKTYPQKSSMDYSDKIKYNIFHNSFLLFITCY